MSDWAEQVVIGIGLAVLFGLLYGMLSHGDDDYELDEKDEALQEKARDDDDG